MIHRPGPTVTCLAAFVVGSIPFSNIAANAVAGVDLRTVGTGTVSGTGLFQVAGVRPLILAGIGDVAKGAVGPLLAGAGRPGLAAAAAAAGVTGHNWSPFLHGAGGRGISVAIGALVVHNWPGSVVLLGGLALGRIPDQAGLGGLLADVVLVPVLGRARGRRGVLAGLAVVIPMLAKRLAGNRRPGRPTPAVYIRRLLLDADPPREGAP